jgi:hypothetical protein
MNASGASGVIFALDIFGDAMVLCSGIAEYTGRAMRRTSEKMEDQNIQKLKKLYKVEVVDP